MPLFSYMCDKCDLTVEIFIHNGDNEIELECEECNGQLFTRIFGQVITNTRYNAKDTMEKRINPEVERIRKKVSNGSDKDFLDIAGD